jgi:GT2 family glycosyltransferase
VDYLDLLRHLHETRRPRTYLEIGVFSGDSLRLAGPDAVRVGVDPDPRVNESDLSGAHIELMTSDAFFAGPRPETLFGETAVDLVFIDGMHLFEYALHDFFCSEALAAPDSLIAIHDVLPSDRALASRERRTESWTGDVWKLVLCLLDHRPDLTISLVDAPPSGLGLVTNLDPQNHDLRDRYDELAEAYVPLQFDVWEERRAEVAARTALTVNELLVSALKRLESERNVRTELAVERERLEAIFRSTSWRISAPVRVLGRHVEGLRISSLGGEARKLAGRVRRTRRPHGQGSKGAREAGEECQDPLLLAATARSLPYRPTISLLMPVYDTAPSLLHAAVASVQGQAYPEWELCVCDDGSTSLAAAAVLDELEGLDPRIRVVRLRENNGIAAATNAALSLATGEFVAMLDHDDELRPGALLAVAELINARPDIDAVFTDQASLEEDGSGATPFRKPDWCLELFRGVMYVGHLLTVRRSLANELGGFDSTYDNVQDFEFMLRVAEVTDRITHLGSVQYHWRRVPGSVAFAHDAKADIGDLQAAAVNAHLRRCGVDAQARPHPDLPHRVLMEPGMPSRDGSVSVIILARGAERYVESCARHIMSDSDRLCREVIVAGGELTSDVRDRLEELGVSFAGAGLLGSGESAAAGIAAASSEVVVWMAGDLVVLSPRWLAHMCLDCRLPGVACVSPVILSPAGRVSSAGLVVDATEAVMPAMSGSEPGDDGYAGSLSCVREVSATSGLCIAVRRVVLEDLGGIDPCFSTSYYQGVELSVRASSEGMRNLCTPRVQMRRNRDCAVDRDALELDRLLLRDRWEFHLAKGDPYWPRGRACTITRGEA